MHHKALWSLTKRANRGFLGYPVGTIAFYGPDDRRASKVAVGILSAENAEASELKRWFSDEHDVRDDVEIMAAIADFLEQHGAKTVALADRIVGCPHEEGTDYPRWADMPEVSILGKARSMVWRGPAVMCTAHAPALSHHPGG